MTIEDILKDLEKSLLSAIPNTEPTSLYEPAIYTLKNGGKRFRPLLCMLSCAIESGEFQRSLPAATAIELLHNFTLLHDDIMDDAPLRRGNPSVYAKWGPNTAILSGDALFTLAMETLLKTEVDAGVLVRIQKRFLEAVRVVCEGQAMDMDFENREFVQIDEYEDMIFRKTSALIEAAMEIGAMISGADDEVVKMHGNIGRNMGIGFQIQDDWLDAGANSDTFGKTRGGDVKAGKKTYLWISLLDRAADEEEKNLFLNTFKRASSEKDALDKVLLWFEERGIMDKTHKKFLSHYAEGQKWLDQLAENQWKTQLNYIYQTLIEREY